MSNRQPKVGERWQHRTETCIVTVKSVEGDLVHWRCNCCVAFGASTLESFLMEYEAPKDANNGE
jgi:hypothetical protein